MNDMLCVTYLNNLIDCKFILGENDMAECRCGRQYGHEPNLREVRCECGESFWVQGE